MGTPWAHCGATIAMMPSRFPYSLHRQLVDRARVAPTSQAQYSRPHWRRSPRRRSGMVLILVLIVVAMLALTGFTFTELTFTERKAAWLFGREVQAKAAMESGVELLRARLDSSVATENQRRPETPDTLWRDVVVFNDPLRQITGRFSIVAPQANFTTEGEPTWGAVSDAARLNLNALPYWDRHAPFAARHALLALPGMTDEIADSILDWIDADDEPRPFGAEADDYLASGLSYTPRNGPMASIDELLLVRGVTPTLLFGPRSTANGLGSSLLESGDNSDSQLNDHENLDRSGFSGWAGFLTLFSAEKNIDRQGRPRIDLNDADLQRMHRRLQERFGSRVATFVVLYRQYGPSSDNTTNNVAEIPESIDYSVPAKHRLRSPVEWIGARVQVPQGSKTQTIMSPWKNEASQLADVLPELLNACSISSRSVIRGRIDIMAAPPEVLAAIPGISPVQVDAIASARAKFVSEDAAQQPATLAWLVTEGVLDLQALHAILPFATARSDVYRAHVAGYLDAPGAVVHCEVVIDATRSPPQVAARRSYEPLSRHEAARRLGLHWLATTATSN